ncbi:MAG: ankyrin repeat domain-containing protein [Bacteroidota bacterium]
MKPNLSPKEIAKFSDVVLFGYLEEAKAMLEEKPELLNAQDPFGFTALHNVMTEEHFSIVRYLIEQGAKVNIQNDEGIAPLHLACYPEHAGLLVEAGADINLTDQKGNTPLHILAAEGEERYEVIEFLLDKGADQTLKNKEGYTPLDIAKIREEKDLIDLFQGD